MVAVVLAMMLMVVMIRVALKMVVVAVVVVVGVMAVVAVVCEPAWWDRVGFFVPKTSYNTYNYTLPY